MVASTMDNLIHVGTSNTDPLGRFNLYQLPGQGDSPQDFLLVPEGSPAHSLSVVHTYQCSDVIELPHDAVAAKEKKQNSSTSRQSCKHSWKAEAHPLSPSYSVHPSVQDAAIRLWRAPVSTDKYPGAVTIRGTGPFVSQFMFVHDGSWKVSTRDDDPGLGGYWIPEPPLPVSLPMYDGPPCKIACESLSVRSAIAKVAFLAILASMFY